MKLYELAENYNNLYELIDNEEIPVEIIEEGLSEIEDAIEVKYENMAKIIKNTEVLIEALDKEEKRIKARKKTLENKIKSLKGYMVDNLIVMDRTSVEAGTFKVRRQKNPDSVQIVDPNKLDEKYIVTKVEKKPNSKEILNALKSGEKVEGAVIAPPSYHIRIQ